MKRKWIPWLAALLCITVLAAASYFCVQESRHRLSITMHGSPVTAITLGQAFTDPGAQATGYDPFGNEADVSVSCQGTVDSNTLGLYRLKYSARYHGKLCTAYRDVYVVESLAPVIHLVSDPDGYTLPNATYEEEGYTAIDWFDGDITHLVKRSVAHGVVTYKVTNSNGLTSTVQRAIRYDDPVFPQLTLSGEAEMTVTAGTNFTEPGYQASDNIDGELTDKVHVTGQVDTYRPGMYQLTYSVTDSWGNTSRAVRNVHVPLPQNDPAHVGDKVIYLTFDDGPGNHTRRLLEILDRYNVQASFFLVGNNAIGLAQQIAGAGHSVGIHSTTHRFSQIYASDEAFFTDLYQMQAILAAQTGQTTYLMRFPGGSSNDISKQYNPGIMTRLTQAVRAQGFCYFDWNVDSKDAGGASSANEVFQNVVAGVKNKDVAIVLQHDIYGFSVDAVERIIIWGLANGYTFLPLTTSSPSFPHRVVN